MAIFVSLFLSCKKKIHYCVGEYLCYEGSLLPVAECVVLKHYWCLIKQTGQFRSITILLYSETVPRTHNARSSTAQMALWETKVRRGIISGHFR